MLGVAECDATVERTAKSRTNNPKELIMHTIVLATQKGGSGKSTLAIGLALAAIQAGHTVRLIETDSQGTLSNWQGRRPYAEPAVEPVYSAGEIEQRLQSLAGSGVTLTIIDTASGVSAATTAAIRYADLCLIPARPSVADIEATAPTLSIIRAWNKPFAFVLNQTPIRGQRVSNAATVLDEEAAFDNSGVLALPYIVMRNDHQDALGLGLAVVEFSPTGKSADEIRGLWQWVENKLNPVALADDQQVLSDYPVAPDVVPTMYLQTPAKAAELVS
jgi:chromosome partitioning protein